MDALRQRLPSREDVLREAKAQSAHDRRKRRLNRIALGVVALAGVLIWDPVLYTRSFTTGAEPPRIWRTQDGSTIALDSHSRLVQETRLRTRAYKLDRGDAIFTVAPDWRPFIVRAGETRVRDISTMFYVKRLPIGEQVSVLEGAVEVNSPAGQRLLHANDTLVAQTHSLTETPLPDLERSTAWRLGKLRFDGTPLAEALHDISRYREQTLRLSADPGNADLRLSGEYDIAQLDALVRDLPLILPVRLRATADGSIEVFPAN